MSNPSSNTSNRMLLMTSFTFTPRCMIYLLVGSRRSRTWWVLGCGQGPERFSQHHRAHWGFGNFNSQGHLRSWCFPVGQWRHQPQQRSLVGYRTGGPRRWRTRPTITPEFLGIAMASKAQSMAKTSSAPEAAGRRCLNSGHVLGATYKLKISVMTLWLYTQCRPG
jgi:hypothetical protein